MIKKHIIHCPILRRLRLGDKFYTIAKPIAAASDAVLKTDLKNCPTCGKRQAWLNGEGQK